MGLLALGKHARRRNIRGSVENPSRKSADPASTELYVVDDDKQCLELLGYMLRESGYNVRTFTNGQASITAAEENPPALILLDVDMGSMNGYEVCSRYKARPRIADIPVIFISGADDTEAKVKAFRSGGVDYITKPFRLEEVMARVHAHLKIHFLQEALSEHNRQLEATVKMRTCELDAALQRLAILDKAKSDFLTLISHELRTPLTGLLGFTDLVLSECQGHPSVQEFKQPYEESRRRLMNILENAMMLSRIEVEAEKFVLSSACLQTAFSLAAEPVTTLAAARAVSLDAYTNLPGWVHGSEELLVKALGALLETALKFAASGTRLAVNSVAAEGRIELTIDALGQKVPAHILDRFFNVLSISETFAPGGDLGLDPPVAERIIVLCGGEVRIENLDPAGIRIRVWLKAAEPVLG